jgi:hypothetical protein
VPVFIGTCLHWGEKKLVSLCPVKGIFSPVYANIVLRNFTSFEINHPDDVLVTTET